MPPITIDDIKARQSELAALIERFEAQDSVGRSIEIEACTIELQAGEHYAGAALDESGHHMHHLVLMAARPDGEVTWQQAMAWAASVGGALPTRQEQALLFANCKPHLEAAWHWSSEVHEVDASYAWYCGFYYGSQSSTHESYEGRAVAVRRF
jgi:hypothetical protein